MLNLSVILEDSARRRAGKDAIVFMDKRITFAQLNGAANQVANGLKDLGIEPGDKVALSCLNLPYFPIIYFGILKAGAVIVPLSVLLKKDEVAYHLNDSDAKAYFCFEGTAELPMGAEGHAGFEATPTCEHFFMITGDPTQPSPIAGTKTFGQFVAKQSPVAETVQTESNDTAVIIYTSGTTGRPKGAELTHSNVLLNATHCSGLMTCTEADVQLLVLPLFHVFGQVVQMCTGFFQGMTTVLLPRFDAEAVFGTMEKEGVTIFAGVPTMYWGLLNYENTKFNMEAISEKLRICMSGGAALPVQVLKDFEAKYKVPILEGYGMSEGSPVVTFNYVDRERKPGSIGVPFWGVEVIIADENDQPLPPGEKGQILYRGHNVMKGYYKRPEANAETLKGGWLHSGDVGIMDEDGYFFIVDRTKDMIIRGGLNVYPREVEEVMIQHKDISLVAVIGVPDEKFGEEIMACIVPTEGATIDEQMIKAWTKERIAAYKYPRMIKVMDALPMSATGKILKKEIRKMV